MFVGCVDLRVHVWRQSPAQIRAQNMQLHSSHAACDFGSISHTSSQIRVRVDVIGHARIKYVVNYQSCMVYNGRLIPHASYNPHLHRHHPLPPFSIATLHPLNQFGHRRLPVCGYLNPLVAATRGCSKLTPQGETAAARQWTCLRLENLGDVPNPPSV